MITWTSLLVAIIVVSIILAALIAFRPAITVGKGGKILAFVALFVFPVLSGGAGISEHMERSKKTEFCLSCHTMDDHGKSLHVDDPSFLAAAHYQNNRVPRDQACFTCHTDYTMFGSYKAKLRGLRHVYVQYIGKVPDKIELYSPYNNRECLHCHEGARSFEEGATHNAEAGRLLQIKTNNLSCNSAGCHDTVHGIDKLSEAKFWNEVKDNGAN